MGTNTLATRADGEVILANFFNDFNTALGGDFVGRSTAGVPLANQNLGTAALPWGIGRFSSLIIDGESLDASLISVSQNRVISGKSLATSEQPSFLLPAGAGNGLSATLEGLATNLVLDINGASVTFAIDAAITTLTAAPAANNTALVNDTSMSNDKYAGEDGTEIIIDTVGNEITSRVGQYAAFKTATGEIFFAYVKSATLLTNAYRGFYFDDGEDPISRGNLSNNDTLTLLNIGWVFASNDAATTDVSYETPVWSFAAPSVSTGKYWYDLTNNVWKRYDGASWVIINRTLAGQLILDTADCIGARSLDFTKAFSDSNNIELEIFSSEIIESNKIGSKINVYGSNIDFGSTLTQFNITTDLDTAVIESASTDYYFYISENGKQIISDVKPYNRNDLKGHYHPYQSWRCVGICFNDSSSDLIAPSHIPYNSEINEESIYVKDVKPSGTLGGTFTAGAWQTRDLNTLSGKSFGSLGANQIILPAGVYKVNGCAIGNLVNNHQTRFYNITDGSTSVLGRNSRATSSDSFHTVSNISGTFTITKSKIFEFQHRAETTAATLGFGNASSWGDEIYSQIEITKIK